jgi:1,4-alpha-glucan branching enzyme
MIKTMFQGRVVGALFPRASAVFLVGPFNHWSTAATPLTPRKEDGLWEAQLPDEARTDDMVFFVFQNGRVGGRVHRYDAPQAQDES